MSEESRNKEEQEEKSWFLTYQDDWICLSCGATMCRECAEIQPHIQRTRHPDDDSIIVRCPVCANMHTFHEGRKVTFQELSKRERGYYVTGRVVCAFCGSALSMASHLVPIEFEELKCPRCGKSQFEITPELVHRLKNGGFTFRIDINCKNGTCRLSSRIMSSFKGIFADIKKLVISLKEGKLEIEKFRNEKA